MNFKESSLIKLFVLPALIAVLAMAILKAAIALNGDSSPFTTGVLFATLWLVGFSSLILDRRLMRHPKEIASRSVSGIVRRDNSKVEPGNETGTVKWFNSKKGYGFISRANGEDLFVHFRSIQGGNRFLRPEQEVEFRVVDGDRGPQAEDVRLVG